MLESMAYRLHRVCMALHRLQKFFDAHISFHVHRYNVSLKYIVSLHKKEEVQQ
jgi:hypothetical protein